MGRSCPSRLAQKGAGGAGSANAAGGAKDAEQYGQVVMGACFFQIGRSKIHRNSASGKGQAGILRRGTDTLPCLLHSCIGQTHDIKAGQAVGNIAFSGHAGSTDTGNAQGTDAANHRKILFSLC